MLGFIVSFALTGCGGEPPVDPLNIKEELTLQPSPVIAGQQTQVAVEFTGVTITEAASVQLDVRLEDRAELIDLSHEGDGRFVGEFTFPEARIFEVYVHFYMDSTHFTRMHQVTVE